jgi:hypothetical protein
MHLTSPRINASVPLRIPTGVLCILLAVFYENGLAQSNAAPLSLKAAVQLALKQNPQVVALRLLSLESDRSNAQTCAPPRVLIK